MLHRKENQWKFLFVKTSANRFLKQAQKMWLQNSTETLYFPFSNALFSSFPLLYLTYPSIIGFLCTHEQDNLCLFPQTCSPTRILFNASLSLAFCSIPSLDHISGEPADRLYQHLLSCLFACLPICLWQTYKRHQSQEREKERETNCYEAYGIRIHLIEMEAVPKKGNISTVFAGEKFHSIFIFGIWNKPNLSVKFNECAI